MALSELFSCKFMNLSKRGFARRLTGTSGFSGNLKNRPGEKESGCVWSFHKCLDEMAGPHILSPCPSGQDFKSRKEASDQPDLGHEPSLDEERVRSLIKST